MKFSEVRDAFDFVSFARPMEHEAYLCLDTSEIYWHSHVADIDQELPEDIDDPDRYIAIPHQHDLGLGKPLALQFASEHLPDAFEQVQNIFSHPGAYARFKDILEHQGMLDKWHEYEDKRGEEALRQWCDENGIETDG